MSPTELLIHDLSNAACAAESILKCHVMELAIEALREIGEVRYAEELELCIAEARDKIREACIAAS